MGVPQFRPAHPDEYKAAREYVYYLGSQKDSSLKLTDAAIVAKDGKLWSVAPARLDNAAKYAIAVDANGDVVHGAPGSEMLILVDVDSSALSFIKTERIRSILRTGGQSVEICPLRNPGIVVVKFSLAWARQNIISKFVEGQEPKYPEFRRQKLMVPERFCHLHVHSHYSFLDGVATPAGLAEAAKNHGQPGIALTDHGNAYGHLKFYKACKEAGVKPLLGIELYIVDDLRYPYLDKDGKRVRFQYHTTVIAMNNDGLRNLNRLISEANLSHFYHVPEIDHRQLLTHNEGLFVTSGCFRGPVAWFCQKKAEPAVVPFDAKGRSMYRTDLDMANRIMRTYRDVLKDRYAVEVQSIDYQQYMDCVPTILEMARGNGVPVLVAADCHYEKPQDAALQAMVTRIAPDSDEGNRVGEGVYFVKSRSEITHPMFTADMFERTCEVMERCTVHIPLPGDDDFKYLFPRYDVQNDRDWPEFVQMANSRRQAKAQAESTEQANHLGRVSERIAYLVIDFYKVRSAAGQLEFRMSDLTDAVKSVAEIAPDSAGRILRSLRQQGLLNYEVTNRAQSLYRLLPLSVAVGND